MALPARAALRSVLRILAARNAQTRRRLSSRSARSCAAAATSRTTRQSRSVEDLPENRPELVAWVAVVLLATQRFVARQTAEHEDFRMWPNDWRQAVFHRVAVRLRARPDRWSGRSVRC